MTANDNNAKNILGGILETCCFEPNTGFYRDGFCNTGIEDNGKHIICVVVTDEFLEFSKKMGNDLSTPMQGFSFPGLKAGDKWCLCITRWIEALENKCAPKIVLESCHQECLKYVPLDTLKQYAVKILER